MALDWGCVCTDAYFSMITREYAELLKLWVWAVFVLLLTTAFLG